jgi:hypothetical protein
MDDLDYISSAADLQHAKREVKSQDETDMSTLERVNLLLDEYIERYQTINFLTTDESQFSVREQLALNKRSVLLAEELKLLVDTTINDVKEKYNNG